MDSENTLVKIEMIRADIARAQENLDALPEGARRGLKLETLKEFGCGFIGNWISPDSRIGNYYETPTPRLIIPSGDHYLARLIVPVENFPESQRRYIKPKAHAGTKGIFNAGTIDTVNQTWFLTVTEGEIDAMSIWQATPTPVVAVGGVSGYHRFLEQLKKLGYGNGGKTIRILIAFDPDDSGRKAAAGFRTAAIEDGIPAAVHFLTEDVSKTDFNDLLRENGADAIIDWFDSIGKGLDAEFAAAEKEIAERRQSAVDDNIASDFARAHNLERGVPVEGTAVKSKSVANAGNDDPPEYTQDFITAMLDVIDPKTLDSDDWLSVVSSLKNLGVPDNVIDSWNLRDPDKYNQRENLSRLKSLSDPNFGIGNLKGKARAVGFDFKSFKREWYQQHPEYSRPLPNRRRANPSAPRADDPRADKSPVADSRFDIPSDMWNKLLLKPQTNLDDAERIIDVFGDRISYNVDTAQFGFYHEGTWNFSANGNSAVLPYARAISDFIRDNTPAEPKPCASDAPAEEKEKFDKQRSEYLTVKALAKRWSSRNNVAAAVEMLKCYHEIFITTNDLDNHPELFNVANGVVDLETGRLHPHAPDLLLTKKSNVVYNPRIRSPLFERTLAQIIPDESTRAAVLRFLGYCLTGCIREHKALFVYGRGGNGKGTLFGTVLKILGGLATTLRQETFALRPLPRDGENPTPEISKLVGVRLGVVEELMENVRLNVSLFKNLTGGDAYSYRLPFQNSQTNEHPTHKFIFSGNFLPDLRNADDDGLRRRLMVVNFPRQFLEDDADRTLPDRLSTPENLTGALTLLVEQAVLWNKKGLLESADMKEAKKEYISGNDWLADFVSEHCVLGADKSCTRSDMLAELAEFKPARGLSPRTLTNMIKNLEGVSYGRSGSNGARRFSGIGLLTDETN